MTVRLAGRGDLSALLGLLAHLSGEAPAPPEAAAPVWERMLAQPGMQVFVAEVDGAAGPALGATCTLIIVPNLTRGLRPYALIENVVTSPAYRRMGLGQAVLAAACEAAWAEGCYKVMLMTGSTNPATHAFYREAGFAQSKTGYQIRRS